MYIVLLPKVCFCFLSSHSLWKINTWKARSLHTFTNHQAILWPCPFSRISFWSPLAQPQPHSTRLLFALYQKIFMCLLFWKYSIAFWLLFLWCQSCKCSGKKLLPKKKQKSWIFSWILLKATCSSHHPITRPFPSPPAMSAKYTI